MTSSANTIRRAYGDPTTRAVIANWPDVAWVGLARLHHQLRRSPHDEQLQALVELAEAACSELPPPSVPADDLVVCPHFRAGDRIIRTISLVARFDSLRAAARLRRPAHDEDAERVRHRGVRRARRGAAP